MEKQKTRLFLSVRVTLLCKLKWCPSAAIGLTLQFFKRAPLDVIHILHRHTHTHTVSQHVIHLLMEIVGIWSRSAWRTKRLGAMAVSLPSRLTSTAITLGKWLSHYCHIPEPSPVRVCVCVSDIDVGGSGSWCDPLAGSIAGPSELTDGKPEPDSPPENFCHIRPLTDSERTTVPRPPAAPIPAWESFCFQTSCENIYLSLYIVWL